MEKIDILKIASLNDSDREKTMQELFKTMLSMSDVEKTAVLKELVKEMAEKASDSQYLNLCITNLKLASSLDDETLKAFLKLRMSVSSSLPKDLAERDMKFIKEGLGKADENTRAKISKFLQ
jgi:hypothetical protein